MRTLKFSNVISGVAQLAGLDRDSLPNHFFKQVRDLANPRLSLAWETENWPGITRIEELAVTTSSDISTIAYPTTAGEILKVYDKNPRKTTVLSSVDYLLYDDGTDSDTNSGKTITVYSTTSPLYVEYRILKPQLIGDVYSSTTQYANGTQVYYSTEGHFYTRKNQSGSESDIAPTTTADWDKVLIPKIFENYLIRGIYADYLRANGQTDLAVAEDSNAEGLMILEADKIYRQQGQIRTINFIGY